MVRNGFEGADPDEVLARRRARLVELHVAHAPTGELAEHRARPIVGASASAIVRSGARKASTMLVEAAVPDAKSSASPPSSSPSCRSASATVGLEKRE